MAYKCISCKKEIKEVEDHIRCPYCGQRVLVKARADMLRTVKAV
ncbi:MAG TPA: DNA-directed RNA polymerase subunit P [archaeon]|nr:DNA-directed RNA polymerase subunit P [archaeon]